jgi:hypothetical protein
MLNGEFSMLRSFALIVSLLGASALASAASPAKEVTVPKFIEESAAAGMVSRYEDDNDYFVGGGTAVFDCDNDGMPEVFIAGGLNTSKFFRNRSLRGGPIKLEETRSGLEMAGTIGAYPLDIDGDGIVDLVILRVGQVEVYRGAGGCNFERVTDKWNVHSGNGWHTAFSATWEKGQTWPTLAIGTYIDRDKRTFPWGNCTPTLLFRPASASGGGYEAPIEMTPGHCALSMLFHDWSGKGQTLLRVSNDREFYKGGKEQMWALDGGGSPRELGEKDGWRPLQVWGMGIAARDLDGDGAPEVFLTSMADSKLQTLEAGATAPTYRDIAFAAGVSAHRPYVGGDVRPSTGWHAQFEDMNNDGLVDLFISKGNVVGEHFAMLDPNNLLLQVGPLKFEEFGDRAGIASVKQGRGAMVADLNMDGLLDLIVVNRWDNAELWRHLPNEEKSRKSANWVQLRLKQDGGNSWAVGAMLELEAGGIVQRREITVGGGHASGSMTWTHFGLGKASTAKVRVRWPDGEVGPWIGLRAGEFFVIDRKNVASTFVAGGQK